MYKAVHLITNENDEETLKKITDYIKEKYTLETKIFSNTLRIDKTHDKTLHLLLLDDKNVKEFLKDNLNSSIQIGLLPHDQCPNTISNYGICSDIYEAIDEIKKYGNLQKRTQDFFDNEYEVLYTKIVARQLLKQDDYINRNATLMRSVDKFNQKYSNDYRNTEYQEKHTAYFVSLNSIFWWIYYILCLVILYQIVYIQNEMGLKTKVILGMGLMLYPLSYRIYDLVVTKK